MSLRTDKVESLLQQQAARVLNEEYVFPGLALTVTKVDVSPNLKNAKIFIGMVGKGQEDAKTALSSHAPGQIARYLAGHSQMRTIPHINLVFDDSAEYAEHISRLLKDIK